MKKIISVILVTAMIFSYGIPSFATNIGEDSDVGNYVANEILIKRRTTLARTFSADNLPVLKTEVIDVSAIEETPGVQMESTAKTFSSTTSCTQIIKCTVESGTDVEELCRTLEKRSDIISAAPNYIYSTDEIEIPEEALGNGDQYLNYNWYKNSLELTEAWKNFNTLGSADTVVAIIDTGLNINHKDIKNNLWNDGNGNHGWNAVNGNYDITDTNGHGTNVAGIIGMEANGFGYVGIAPNVKIMGLKAATGNNLTDDDIIECLNYAIENNADIINMSFGGTVLSPICAELYQKAAQKAVLVSAAGNSSYDADDILCYPAAYNGVIGVMAYGSYNKQDIKYYNCDNGMLASFSNYDSTGLYYTTSAPGVEILGPSCNNNTDFEAYSGTSQATPIVAGIAALYLSLYPNASPYQVEKAIADGSTKTVTGYYNKKNYPAVNINDILSQEPAEIKTVTLSDNAKKLLNYIYGTNDTEFNEAQVNGISLVLADDLSQSTVPAETVKEITNVLAVEYSGLGLSNTDLSFLKTSVFPKLNILYMDNNPLLTELSFSETSAPHIKYIYCEECSLADLNDFTPLKSLSGLNAYGNLFETTLPLAELKNLKTAILYSCRLKDTIGIKNHTSMTKLDISDNYISDISPLNGFCGYYLDISDNPVSKGNNYSGFIKNIRESMNHNSYSYTTIQFYHDNMNGNSEKTYSDSETLMLQETEIPRTAEAFQLQIQSYPESANMNNICTFYSDDITVGEYSGEISIDKTTLPESASVTVCPTSKYPSFMAKIVFSSPKAYEYKNENGRYTVTANNATSYIKSGGKNFYDYYEENKFRYFDLGDSAPGETACACDSVGEGGSVSLGTEFKTAQIISVISEKEEYASGETAEIKVTASADSNYLLVKDINANGSMILTPSQQDENESSFTFSKTFTTSGTYKFKLYAGNTAAFKPGAYVFSCNVKTGVQNIKLASEHDANLYMSYDRSLSITPSFYPENAELGQTITYKSLNSDIASVSQDGTVTAESYGQTVISAENEYGLSANFFINVTQPRISSAEAISGTQSEETVFTFYTAGAENIIITDKSNNPIGTPYTADYIESNIDGYDRLWTVRATFNSEEKITVRIYAVDQNGLNTADSNFSELTFQCEKPLESFDIYSDSLSFDRTDKNIKVYAETNPVDSNAVITWSCSPSSAATVQSCGNYCVVTPKETGTATISATAKINSVNTTKSMQLTFTEGSILSTVLPDKEIAPYEPFTAEIHTSKTITYLHLWDTYSLYGTEYSDYHFYTDTETERIWRIPFSVTGTVDTIRVWGGDSVGNISEPTYYPVNTYAPSEESIAFNTGTYTGSAGKNMAYSVFYLPDNTNITESCTVSISNPEIAHTSGNYIYFDNPGTTDITCTYDGLSVTSSVVVYQPAQSITISENSKMLEPGESFSLHADIFPSDCTDTIQYDSSDEAIASVENGIVTAVSYGTAYITVKADSGVTSTVKITVKNKLTTEKITFEKTEYTCMLGESFSPKINIFPADSTNGITLVSENSKIVKIDEDGTAIGVRYGKTTITAETDNGLSASAEVEVTADLRLSLSRQYITARINSMVSLSAVITPEGSEQSGTFYSDNEAVAYVTQNGYVYTKSAGNCNIFYLSESGLTESCRVEVYEAPLTRLTLESFENDTLEMNVFDSYCVGYTPNPSYSDELPLWQSSNESVAEIDVNGIIYAKSTGTSVITASTESGKKYTFNVKVNAACANITGQSTPGAYITLTSSNGDVYTAGNNPCFSDIPFGTYNLRIYDLHHTFIEINEIIVKGDMDLGSLYIFNGDANGDNSIDITDISELVKEGIYGSDSSGKEEYDMDDNGTISVTDIAEILKYENFLKSGKCILY